ncbi:MAG: hypothetical protein RJB66_60 [Pseudomonadota bacterium]|jgi:hypothetical protein
MSIILFFGSALLVTLVSTVYVVVAIRHLIKNRKVSSLDVSKSSGSVR